MRLAANLSLLFQELPFLDRFAAAAGAGFKGVECLFPYAYDREALAQLLRTHDLTLVLFDFPAGDWDAGERGIGCDPARVAEFRLGVETAVGYATALGCRRLNCLSGIAPSGVAESLLTEIFVGNLRYAAGCLREAGLSLLIEPINSRDIPGYFLRHTRQALEILEEVGAGNAFLQYDVYHMTIMEGAVSQALERHLRSIGHIQIADYPGRHEPGTGQVDFNSLFAQIDHLGYQGWVGCEYIPLGRTEEGLSWAQPYLRVAQTTDAQG